MKTRIVLLATLVLTIAPAFAQQPTDDPVRWYHLAAEQGHVDAWFWLGRMYFEGVGTPQDYLEALRWFQLGAEQGHKPAQAALGNMYFDVKGVPQDLIQAHTWFNLAGEREARNTVAEQMTPAEILEAQKLAREWKPKKK